MEKLINLLNEYGNEKCNHWGNYQTDMDFTDRDTYWYLSKKFGFIKWLVENDKIDIKKLIIKGEMRSGWDFDNKKGDEETGEESWNKYFSELCLMILAIQDEPIKFLIEILKQETHQP